MPELAKRAAVLLAGSPARLALLLALAFALKVTTFGDTSRHVDETFYFLVGQRMHDGLLPYVDVWDRKPLGLFLIYYLLAGISRSVLVYQIAACCFAGMTAWVISRIVARMAPGRAPLLAGATYLIGIVLFEGDSGHAPDFYNLPIAAAVLLSLQQREALERGHAGWRTWAAMALCGLAITIKQTALFESLFLGLWTVWTLHRGGAPLARLAATALLCAAIGAAPMLAIAAYYGLAGHWSEFWHAMVTANLAKPVLGGWSQRLLANLVIAAPILAAAMAGLAMRAAAWRDRGFVVAWLVAALIGYASVPNFYGHYTLPLIAVLAVAAGLFYGAFARWLVPFALTAAWLTIWQPLDQRQWSRESAATMHQIAQAVRQHDPGGGLLVFDAPPYLYALSAKPFLSPLVFPQHLNQQIENNVSHLDTRAEIDRILARGPGVIVMARVQRNLPVNAYSLERVQAYVRANCRFSQTVLLREKQNRTAMDIFGDCTVSKSLSHRF